MKRPVLRALRLYKAAVSPYMPGMCRFEPTCSVYAAEAVTRFGAFKGSGLAVWRVMRCHPWSRGGHDPVPGAAG
jgi:hypothetical protein